jgi:hypothetical protein
VWNLSFHTPHCWLPVERNNYVTESRKKLINLPS